MGSSVRWLSVTADPLPLEGWLEETGALRKGHFRLSSGLHSPAYVQCALLLEDPQRAERIGAELAGQLGDRQVQSVLSPAMGGLIIGFAVAASLGVSFRFVERLEEQMTLRRGFALRQGERILIVEDVVTTGKSTLEAMTVAREHGAEICAVASILDRTAGRNPFGVPFVSLFDLVLPTFSPEECPLCAAGQALVKPGSRPVP